MPTDPKAPLSFSRLHSVRVAGGMDALRQGLADLSDADVRHLARSLEFQAALDGEPPDLLARLRPRLRLLRPERVGSIERMCWRPLERFLTDQTEVVTGAPWIIPRRMLRPLWSIIEAANPDLVDQLRRRHLIASFDGDQETLEQVAHQVTDLAAFILNNAANIPVRLKLSTAESAAVRFTARVMKWHRMIMPNVRHFQQAQTLQADHVHALRLYTNWYSVFELLDTQFDLYVLYLFEMTPNPVNVIDAFPFYFDTMKEVSGLAVQWIHHRLDNVAADVATLLARPPRTQSTEILLDLTDRIFLLNALVTRLRLIPIFAPDGAGAEGLLSLLRGRLGLDSVERLGDALLDWLHDVMMGPADKRMRANMVLGPLSGIYPALLSLVDSGDRGNRVQKLRMRLSDKAVDDVDRYLRSHEMAPQARHATAANIAPIMEMCRIFGKAEAVADLERRIRR